MQVPTVELKFVEGVLCAREEGGSVWYPVRAGFLSDSGRLSFEVQTPEYDSRYGDEGSPAFLVFLP
jgi:hypothetical protein